MKTRLHDGMDTNDDHYPTPKPEHTFATIWPKMKAAAAEDTCPWCKLPFIECACEEPEPEPVRCVECGMPLFLCECDVKILEEE